VKERERERTEEKGRKRENIKGRGEIKRYKNKGERMRKKKTDRGRYS
jgi:hypothetical protein